jgi:hypothetical protein
LSAFWTGRRSRLIERSEGEDAHRRLRAGGSPGGEDERVGLCSDRVEHNLPAGLAELGVVWKTTTLLRRSGRLAWKRKGMDGASAVSLAGQGAIRSPESTTSREVGV